MIEPMGELKRTAMCGEIQENAAIGEEVVVMGWVNRRRDLGTLIFITIRDRTGLVQITIDKDLVVGELFEKANALRQEYVVAVKGFVRARSEKNINPDMKTGRIEIEANDIKILSIAETPPIQVADENVREDMRLKYRYLDLRRPEIQKSLEIRHQTAKAVREFLSDNGYLEIETPFLGKSTPEGARDYVVPSRIHRGSFYALPQSPQQYKQLLMVSGFDKYFQIVKCFRDEDLRSQRQPEFTQIDIEASFVTQDDIIEMNEALMKHVFFEVLGEEIKTPFLRMTYKEAMERFGVDKPDMRFGMELENISDLVKDAGFGVFSSAVGGGGSVRGIRVPQGDKAFSRKDIDKLVEFAKDFGAKGVVDFRIREEGVASGVAKFFTEEEVTAIVDRMQGEIGDILLFVADKNNDVVFSTLGNLRVKIANTLDILDTSEYNFLWVIEFPMFEKDEEENRLVAVHHPFTRPMAEDMDLLDIDPTKVRAIAHDIVLNGEEIGGGSLRIFEPELQSKIFEIIGIDKDVAQNEFGHLLEAFTYGAPPHGGIAYGFDRLVMFLAKVDAIRDVIAFPKVKDASCPMTKAPSPLTKEQLDELHLAIIPLDE